MAAKTVYACIPYTYNMYVVFHTHKILISFIAFIINLKNKQNIRKNVIYCTFHVYNHQFNIKTNWEKWNCWRMFFSRALSFHLLIQKNTHFTWHCWGPCLFGDAAFGLGLFTANFTMSVDVLLLDFFSSVDVVVTETKFWLKLNM